MHPPCLSRNVLDLKKILEWNVEHGINSIRLSSNVFPWASEYQLCDMPDYEAIWDACETAGNYAKKHGIRLTSHPGPFNKLASPKNACLRTQSVTWRFMVNCSTCLACPEIITQKRSTFMSVQHTETSPVALDTFVRTLSDFPESLLPD